MLQPPLQRDRANEMWCQLDEQPFLTGRWSPIQQPVARKVPGRGRAGKQIGNEWLGAEPSRPPPVLIKRRAAELVRRDDIGPVENLTGRIGCDARQARIRWRPVDKA